MIESTLFVSSVGSPSRLYTFDGLMNALRDLTTVGINDMVFNIGQDAGGSLEQGLVNIALFIAHAQTRGMFWDTCEGKEFLLLFLCSS